MRWLANGELEFIGRSDAQVKVRGSIALELGEIEAALREHPGVRQFVVIPRDDGAAGKRLVVTWRP